MFPGSRIMQIGFGLVALATISAGWLYDRFGWATLNLAVVPLLILALIVAVGIEHVDDILADIDQALKAAV